MMALMITITEKAAAKVKEISSSESLDGQGLRLRVIGGGCAGFSYDLYFEDKMTEEDEQYESHGVKLYVDPHSHLYLEETEIDDHPRSRIRAATNCNLCSIRMTMDPATCFRLDEASQGVSRLEPELFAEFKHQGIPISL